MNAPSSTTTGRAEGGSRTPPIPTPPERWTPRPIWAHEPTVAQVSTMVPLPTQAPILTKPGITTTPGSQNAPYLTIPGGTTRTPAAVRFFFVGIRSCHSNGPTSTVSIGRSRK